MDNSPKKLKTPIAPVTPKEIKKPSDIIATKTSSPSAAALNPVPRISIFGAVRRLREQRYCMVQSISQYEFIYEYILDYLSSTGIVELKYPRNTFGLDDDEDSTAKQADGEEEEAADSDEGIKASTQSKDEQKTESKPNDQQSEDAMHTAETTERTQIA